MNFPGKETVRRLLGRTAWRGARCCFVLSTGRTGSQTLTSLLNLSDEVRAFHEPAPQLLAETREAFESVQLQPERFKKIFADAKSADIGISRIRGKLYAETSNRLTFLAPVIAELLPRAKFIYLHRQPAEVVRSGMRRRWYDNHPWDPYRIAPRQTDAAFSQWAEWDCFAKTCWYWTAINDFSLEFMKQISPERRMALPFDELMDADSDAWMRIYNFLDVTAPHLYAVREVLSRRENQQNSGQFAAPSEWSNEHWEVLRQIAGSTAKKLGYEIETTAGRVASMRAS